MVLSLICKASTPKQEEGEAESTTSKKRKRQYGQIYGKELQDRIVQVIDEAHDKGMTRRVCNPYHNM